jgi:hypothetical protein
MDCSEGAGKTDDARLGFDRRVRLEFHGSKISSDGGLLLFRELDEDLCLQDIAGGLLRDDCAIRKASIATLYLAKRRFGVPPTSASGSAM